MIETRSYHGITLDIVKSLTDRICYIILPEGLKEAGLSWMENASNKYGTTIVIMSGMDWNDAMTPWSSGSSLFKKAKAFGGHGGTFLNSMKNDYFISIESSLGIKHAARTLVGVSLSGLFALWAGHKCDLFTGIASISGSFWYDGFVEWTGKNSLSPSVERIYLSLGENEKKAKDKKLATVETATREIVDILREKGKAVEFNLEKNTTHFSPVVPRLEKALEALYWDCAVPVTDQ